jgi:hypothetical protein
MFKRVGRLGAAVVVSVLVVACQATIHRQVWENEYVRGSSTGGSITVTQQQASVSLNDIKIVPKKKLCDVKATVTGDPSKPGTTLFESPGEFKGWSHRNFTIALRKPVKQVFLVITGRPCDETGSRVLGVVSINEAGVVPPSGPPETGPSLAICGSSRRPHFVEFTQLRRGRYRFTIGDLAAVSSPARQIYAARQRLVPTFLGALVFVNGQLVHWVFGPGSHAVELPAFRGKLSNVMVLTIDRDGHLAQTFRLGELNL